MGPLARGAIAAVLASGMTGAALAQPAVQLPLDRLRPGTARQAAPLPADGVAFLVRYPGAARGIETGTPVEINGLRVGAVRSAVLDYDAAARRFVVAIELLLDPAALPPVNGRRARTPEETIAMIGALVQAGLRARPASTRLVGGETVLALTMQPDAPAAAAPAATGGLPEIPSAPSHAEEAAERVQELLERLSRAPVEQMVADLQEAMAALKGLATGPELRDTLAGLRDGAAELRTQVARLSGRVDPILNSLNDTVRTANRTLGNFDRQLGDRSPMIADLQAMLREMNGAARSLRLMAEYLERNPDALLRGKSDNRR